MKVGLVLECGPHGADQQVCEYLAKRLAPETELSTATLGNKPNLLRECGTAVVSLLAEGCERVVIVWDLYPAWRRGEDNPCRHEDKEAIRSSLLEAGIASPHVHLVCIQEELEAWLLADERALRAVLAKPTHPVRIRRTSQPERISNPKKQLGRLYQEHTGRRYVDLQDAIRIVQRIEDWQRLRRCETFARFALKVANVTLSGR
ncbi:MAG: DUF4276 family protein [Chloroflexota bacterium]